MSMMLDGRMFLKASKRVKRQNWSDPERKGKKCTKRIQYCMCFGRLGPVFQIRTIRRESDRHLHWTWSLKQVREAQKWNFTIISDRGFKRRAPCGPKPDVPRPRRTFHKKQVIKNHRTFKYAGRVARSSTPFFATWLCRLFPMKIL